MTEAGVSPKTGDAMKPLLDLAWRLAFRGVFGISIIDAILFGVAGRLDWAAAWGMSGMSAAYVGAGMVWFLRREPDLMRERITRAANVPRWDRVCTWFEDQMLRVELAGYKEYALDVRQRRVPGLW